MAGISSKAFGGVENRYKYNGIELDTSLGLDEYEAQLRDLDPQTGRWWQVDPETEDQEMWSPYTSNYNNPILYQDPRGNEGEACCGGLLFPITPADMNGAAYFFNEYLNPVTPFVEFITGKSHESGFTESKSRSQSAKEAALQIVPGDRIESASVRIAEKALAESEVKPVEKSLVKNIKESAKNISKDLNGDKARVEIRSEKEMKRIDLTGERHYDKKTKT